MKIETNDIRFRMTGLGLVLILLIIITAFVVRTNSSNAALNYDNAAVADIMLRYVGQNGVEVCRSAGRSLSYPGECKQTVNCALSMASGGAQYPVSGNSFYDQFINAGGIEISSSNATKGDIIQTSSHTAVVLTNYGNGKFSVVDSNWNYTGIVSIHDWTPSGARFFRMGAVKSIAPTSQACDSVAPNTTCVWRLIHNSTGYHFYTTNIEERNSIISNGSYRLEGIAFYARTNAASGTTPVYRLRWGNKHFWTSAINERNQLQASGAVYEGIAWYSNSAELTSGYTIYRLYNNSSGDHLWTTNKLEVDSIVKNGWQLEGIPFYGSSPMVNDGYKTVGQAYVYRVLLNNEHFYTTSIIERDTVLRRNGSSYEGIVWTVSDQSNNSPVYRLLKPDGRHFWTSNINERNVLMAAPGWKYEGIAWYDREDVRISVYRLYNQLTGDHFWTSTEAEKNYAISNLGYYFEGLMR